MGKIAVAKGKIIHSDYEIVDSIEIILSGSVKVKGTSSEFNLTAGGLIGVLETPDTSYNFTYEASEDCSIFSYPYAKPADIEKIVSSNPKIIMNLASAAIRMYMDTFQQYQKAQNDADALYRFVLDTFTSYVDLCSKFKVPPQALSYIDTLEAFSPEEAVGSWEAQYFNSIKNMAPELKKAFYSASVYMGVGIVMEAIRGTQLLLSLKAEADDYLYTISSYVVSGDAGDFFDLFYNLMANVTKNPFADTTAIEASVSKMIIYMTGSKYIDMPLLHARVQNYRNQLREIEERLLSADDEIDAPKDAYEALDHSMETIFDYALINPEQREDFRGLIERYKLMSDKNATDDDARKLRRSISDLYYKIYKSAFFRCMEEKSAPVVVMMFFYFGYIDEELAGISNAAILYEMVQKMEKDPDNVVVPLFDWVRMIYDGKAEPSKNEFDLDYPAFLREERISGNISKEQEQAFLTDRKKKAEHELNNMFQVGNRITFGRLSTFCPIFSEHNILRPLANILLTPELVYKAIDAVREVDYGCFYRDVMYTNPSVGINQEYVAKEVLPNVILMPNLGTRGSLWQETADSRRDSRGRIMLSILPIENINDIMIKLSGEFRWELCKKIQGVHWNDVTDPSLTAEYCDYIQFYRKNHELSTDAKEKIKAALQKAKNNYREVFVMDYVQWIKYEGHGSPRLNRYVRSMMFRYCTFPKSIRDGLVENPLYANDREKYDVKLKQKLHSLDLICQKVKNAGKEVPEELVKQREFLLM